MDPEVMRRKEIYTYHAPWTIYAMNWSVREAEAFRFRLAIGSFMEDFKNKIQIIQLDEEKGSFGTLGGFDHAYPSTKVMWCPDRGGMYPDLLATTGDYLRLWEVKRSGVEMRCCLNNSKSSEFCAPLTSFDWNEADPAVIGTSSVDTTCTIWNVELQQAKTQLIAHDKEVYDIAFARGTDVFASVGADGSVRMFDLRSLDHSTIMYESQELTPLLRLCWNKQDPNYLVTSICNSSKVIVLDIRVPSMPAAELNGHLAPVSSLAWAPHSSCHVCSAGDDHQALIWDLSNLPKSIEDPILGYQCGSEINQLQWSAAQHDWVAIAFDDKLQILRV